MDKTPPEGIVWNKSMFLKKTPDWAKIAALCKRYTLKSILKELPVEEPEVPEVNEFDLFAVPAPAPAPAKEPEKPEPKNDYEQRKPKRRR
ncbi:MAG: hypothetical protein IKB25_12865 [Lentisphaeria bacterium]|nr:hypothetical protein [Lentisphaeria bacterium]